MAFEDPGDWKSTTWIGNGRVQPRATLGATPAQRLAWLEDATELAYRAGAFKVEDAQKLSRPKVSAASR